MTEPVHPSRLPPAPGTRRRGALRRFLETRGTVGRHRAPHVETRLVASDGVRLQGTYLPGPHGAEGAVLLVHGFAANRKKPAYAYLADVLSRRLHVLSLDLRGHGGSGGASTFGDREALDVEAGIGWLRAYGHRHITVVGLSMGGTSALHAGARDAGADAFVAVSSPARLRAEPESLAMRRLRAVWVSPWKRAGMRALVGVRVVAPSGWTSPPHPEEAAESVRAPLLVVHGEDDAYFPLSDAEAVAARAAGPSVLWREPAGFGHAEDGVTREFAERLSAAVIRVREAGRFPERAEVVQ